MARLLSLDRAPDSSPAPASTFAGGHRQRPQARPMGLLSRYLLRCAALSFATILLLAFMLLCIDEAVRLFHLLINNGAPPGLVLAMLASLFPEYLALALPIGFFLAMLLLVRTLSVTSELDAIQAAGLSIMQIMIPFLWIALLLGGANFYLTGFLQPKSEYRFQKLGNSMQQFVLGSRLQAGTFVSLPGGVTLRFSKVDATGRGGEGLFFSACEDGTCQFFTARGGALLAGERRGYMTLVLDDGHGVIEQPAGEPALPFDFARLRTVIPLPTLSAFRPRPEVGSEATTGEIWAALHRAGALSKEQRTDYRARLLSRLSGVLLFPLLPFLAFGFGIADKRRRSFVGVVLGLASLVGYIELSRLALALAAHGTIPAEWLVAALFLFGAFSITLYGRTVRQPGVPRFSRTRSRFWRWWQKLALHTQTLAASSRMIRRHLLTGYIARRVVFFVLAASMVLLAVVSLIDLLTHVQQILGAKDARWLDLLRYAWLRLPEQFTRFLSLALLLGSLLALLSLSVTHELTMISVAGASPWRIMRPILLVAAAFAAIGFLVASVVAPRANAQLAAWKANGYGGGAGWLRVDERHDVWRAAENLFAHARKVRKLGRVQSLEEALFLRLSPEGRITELLRARSSVGTGTQWSLAAADGTKIDLARGPRAVTADRLRTPALDFFRLPPGVDSMGTVALYRAMQGNRGGPPDRHLVSNELFQRLAGSLMALVMAGLAFAVAGRPQRGSGRDHRILLGLTLGFGVFLAQSLAHALGLVGSLPPVIANFAVPMIAALWASHRVMMATVEARRTR